MNPKNYNQSNKLTGDNSQVSGRINLENNANFNGMSDLNSVYDQTPLKPNYTRQELNNADIPSKIGREIRAQKYRIFFIAFISFIMMVVGIFFVACYYGAKPVQNGAGVDTKWLIPTKNVPQPAGMIVLLAVGLVIFILAMISYSVLLTNVRSYKGDILSGRDTIPYFLIKTYKNLISRVIYANWLAVALYICEGVIIAIFWGLRSTIAKYHGAFNTDLIIMYVIAGVTFLLQMITIITAKYRKDNLNAYFNTQIVSDEQAHEIAHHANKICLICFLVFIAVLAFAIAIPWLIIRKKRRKPLLP